MKILLLKPPVNRVKSESYISLEPPLGLLYLSSFLKSRGYGEIKLLHLFHSAGALEELKETLVEFNPDVVGISAMTAEAKGMHECARLIKDTRPGTLVVAGGPHPTAYGSDTIGDANIDIAVQGEGEVVFWEIVRAHEKRESFGESAGIRYRVNGKVAANSGKNYVSDPDELPPPDWDLVDLRKYSAFVPQTPLLYRQRYLPLFTSRGCPFGCIYCHSVFGEKFRAHSPGRVLNEIRLLQKKFGVSNFEILDDIFNFDRQRVIDIANALAEERLGIKLYFVNGLRGDLLDDETIGLLAEAGTALLSIAIETASPAMQKTIKKRLDLAKAKRAIALSSRKGIFVNGFFMLGFPGETMAEILQTVKFAVFSELTSASFFKVICFEGSELAFLAGPGDKRPFSINDRNDHYQVIAHDSFNCSGFSNLQLKIIFIIANILFFCNPRRLARIFKVFHKGRMLRLLSHEFFLRFLTWR